jgi:hypothetical protein
MHVITLHALGDTHTISGILAAYCLLTVVNFQVRKVNVVQ